MFPSQLRAVIMITIIIMHTCGVLCMIFSAPSECDSIVWSIPDASIFTFAHSLSPYLYPTQNIYRRNFVAVLRAVNRYRIDICWRLAAVRGMDRVCDVAFAYHRWTGSHRVFCVSGRSTVAQIMQSKWCCFQYDRALTGNPARRTITAWSQQCDGQSETKSKFTLLTICCANAPDFII